MCILVVCGKSGKDRYTLQRSCLLKLEHCGHTPQRDREAEVLQALTAFIDRA